MLLMVGPRRSPPSSACWGTRNPRRRGLGAPAQMYGQRDVYFRVVARASSDSPPCDPKRPAEIYLFSSSRPGVLDSNTVPFPRASAFFGRFETRDAVQDVVDVVLQARHRELQTGDLALKGGHLAFSGRELTFHGLELLLARADLSLQRDDDAAKLAQFVAKRRQGVEQPLELRIGCVQSSDELGRGGRQRPKVAHQRQRQIKRKGWPWRHLGLSDMSR